MGKVVHNRCVSFVVFIFDLNVILKSDNNQIHPGRYYLPSFFQQILSPYYMAAIVQYAQFRAENKQMKSLPLVSLHSNGRDTLPKKQTHI